MDLDNSERKGWEPEFSGNHITRHNQTIVKKYRGNKKSFTIESSLLNSLKGFPIPEIINSVFPDELHLQFIDGITGSECIEKGYGKQLLFAMGRFLSRLHQEPIADFTRFLPGDGAVICHGDFAHYNSIMKPDGEELLAILDWEAAYLGDPTSDIAWCEWQFLNRFPMHKWAVQYLYEGFGSTPSHSSREESILNRLKYLQSNYQND